MTLPASQDMDLAETELVGSSKRGLIASSDGGALTLLYLAQGREHFGGRHVQRIASSRSEGGTKRQKREDDRKEQSKGRGKARKGDGGARLRMFGVARVESKPCGFEDPLPPERDELTWTLEEDKRGWQAEYGEVLRTSESWKCLFERGRPWVLSDMKPAVAKLVNASLFKLAQRKKVISSKTSERPERSRRWTRGGISEPGFWHGNAAEIWKFISTQALGVEEYGLARALERIEMVFYHTVPVHAVRFFLGTTVWCLQVDLLGALDSNGTGQVVSGHVQHVADKSIKYRHLRLRINVELIPPEASDQKSSVGSIGVRVTLEVAATVNPRDVDRDIEGRRSISLSLHLPLKLVRCPQDVFRFWSTLYSHFALTLEVRTARYEVNAYHGWDHRSYFRTEVISPWLLPFLDAMSLHTYAFPDMMTFESGVLVLNCTRSTPHAPGCSELFRPMGNKCRELRVFIDIKFKETWLRDEPTCNSEASWQIFSLTSLPSPCTHSAAASSYFPESISPIQPA
ncbi:uncharacterized protein STEHIDRAFT_114854 [Stereum hirsutum FP-91666 SS1]|uniref:uncharacterized protein n=1 Tax=Stereum hirsutum (strain FP-91666) TaxID=721885 RepID=UPI0004449C07|nr:uncharacterized protein STEHIDRAFT_114854 [Stereum hirsutum FP-91666 SS1]EIM81398.1 hypothetical protein STEHIDRAFT_114854 [Stereum hirsutum FP-91666 SS1]